MAKEINAVVSISIGVGKVSKCIIGAFPVSTITTCTMQNHIYKTDLALGISGAHPIITDTDAASGNVAMIDSFTTNGDDIDEQICDMNTWCPHPFLLHGEYWKTYVTDFVHQFKVCKIFDMCKTVYLKFN
jgi:hypothetical protein